MTEIVLTPLAQSEARTVLFLVSSRAGLEVAGPELRRAVMNVDPNRPVFDVSTLAANYRQRTWPFRVFGGLFMTFGLAALSMAAAGFYGVMSRGAPAHAGDWRRPLRRCGTTSGV